MKTGPKPKTTEQFVRDAIMVHKDRFDYSLVDYVNSTSKVKIICKKHGVFEQTPNSHLSQKSGCAQCENERRRNAGFKKFLSGVIKVHGDSYSYDELNYKNNYTKIIISCKKHGPFLQTPKAHLEGQGCPVCNKSKGERKLICVLKSLGINYETEKTFKDCLSPLTGRKLKFDFYIPELNTCIEYDGVQHFEEVKFFCQRSSFKERCLCDETKNIFCVLNGIHLVRFSPSDDITPETVSKKISTLSDGERL